MQKKSESVNIVPTPTVPTAVVNTNTLVNNSPTVATSQVYQVSIKNFAFSPATINIKKGDTVVWTNEDGAPHQIVGGVLKSDVLSTGSTYSFTFTQVGKFDYNCSIHPSMKGEIVVE
jgi:plastocyanin